MSWIKTLVVGDNRVSAMLCAKSTESYAEVVGESRMAWPKLRSRKSPGPLVMITERNGLGRGSEAGAAGAAQPSAVTPAAAEPAAAAPVVPAAGSGPVPWPGTPLPSQRQAAIGPSGYESESG